MNLIKRRKKRNRIPNQNIKKLINKFNYKKMNLYWNQKRQTHHGFISQKKWLLNLEMRVWIKKMHFCRQRWYGENFHNQTKKYTIINIEKMRKDFKNNWKSSLKKDILWQRMAKSQLICMWIQGKNMGRIVLFQKSLWAHIFILQLIMSIKFKSRINAITWKPWKNVDKCGTLLAWKKKKNIS